MINDVISSHVCLASMTFAAAWATLFVASNLWKSQVLQQVMQSSPRLQKTYTCTMCKRLPCTKLLLYKPLRKDYTFSHQLLYTNDHLLTRCLHHIRLQLMPVHVWFRLQQKSYVGRASN